MYALKGLVIGLGVLIVISFVLLIYGFYTKFQDPDFAIFKESTKIEEPSATAAAPRTDLWKTHIALPAGCTLVEMRSEGNRLYVRTGPQGRCQRITIIDVKSGKNLGVVTLTP